MSVVVETGVYVPGALAGLGLALLGGALFAVGYAAFVVLRRVLEP